MNPHTYSLRILTQFLIRLSLTPKYDSASFKKEFNVNNSKLVDYTSVEIKISATAGPYQKKSYTYFD
jgi:hypothetical protein